MRAVTRGRPRWREGRGERRAVGDGGGEEGSARKRVCCHKHAEWRRRGGGGEGGVGGGWRVGRVVRTRRRGFRPVTGRVAEDNSRENRGNERDNEGREGREGGGLD